MSRESVAHSMGAAATRLAVGILFVVFAIHAAAQGAAVKTRISRVDTLMIDSMASLTIGAQPDDQLFEIVGGILWGDTIVIVEGSSKTLRFYLRNGTAVGSVGRYGSGPGEFQNIEWVMRSGNRLVAFDIEQRRLTVFGPLRGVESTTLAATPKPFVAGSVVGRFYDGRLLVQATVAASRPTADAYVSRRHAVLFITSPDAERRDSVGSTATSEYFIRANGRGGQTFAPLLFGKASQTVANGAIAVTVENRGDSIAVLRLADRRWRMSAGLRRDPVITITTAAADRAKANRAKEIGDFVLRARVTEALKDMPVPTTLPRYGWFGEHAMSLLKRTSEGAVWVVGTSGLEAPTPIWTVIGATGIPQALVTARSELEVLDATAAFALVRAWDKDGVERVELRKLIPVRRPAPARR